MASVTPRAVNKSLGFIKRTEASGSWAPTVPPKKKPVIAEMGKAMPAQ